MDGNFSSISEQTGIFQLDGNISCDDSETSSEYQFSNPIKVIVGHRYSSKKTNKSVRIPCRKTIRRDNRGELSLYLPNIAVYNHRSIWKKLNNFCQEFNTLDMGLSFPSEIWERKESKKHKYKIDEILEMEDISSSSTARPDRRDGGCAITCDDKQFFMKEIKLSNPDNLEVTFATLRPKSESSPKFVIILCAVYSPP